MHGAPQTRRFRVVWRSDQPLAPDRPSGPQNIFRSPNPETEAFRFGGVIPVSGEIDDATRTAVHRLVTLLETRINRGVAWKDRIELRTPEERGMLSPDRHALAEASSWTTNDNPFVPSGYTYLLQLVAHDLVDSVRSATIEAVPPKAGEQKPTFELAPVLPNARLRQLMLDTVYGAGPFEEPLPYETDGSSPTEPRTLLRTFRLNKPSGSTGFQYCPFADIMRGSRPAPPENPQQVYRPGGTASAHRTEAFVADPRNDDHSIISQLLVIFHLLHNTVVRKLPSQGPFPKEDFANRRFLCARLVTALIYRHILKQDVLSRVLDPDVYEPYMTNRSNLPLDRSAGIPVEFTVGAFRFGHAMVREDYSPNGTIAVPINFAGARKISATRDGAILGFPDFDWVVDWARFFGPDPLMNLSSRLGPHYATGLVTEPPKGEEISEGFLRDAGLGARDFLSAAYAGMWSVPKLIDIVNDRLQAADLAKLKIAPYCDWKESLLVWLKDYEGNQAPAHKIPTCDIERIAKDPPLPFFVMFEAAHELDAAGRPLRAVHAEPGKPVIPGRGGRHLGRLGSILVADTLFGALHTQHFGFDEFEQSSPHEGIRRICAATVSQEDALDKLFFDSTRAERPLDRMQDLLNIMQSMKVFAEPS